jgi:hypothetical protein
MMWQERRISVRTSFIHSRNIHDDLWSKSSLIAPVLQRYPLLRPYCLRETSPLLATLCVLNTTNILKDLTSEFVRHLGLY